MKKFYHTSAALIISGLFLFSCQKQEKINPPEYHGKKIANPIVYEVLVNNPNPEDEWKTECLANTNIKIMVNDIIEAAKNGTLSTFDYYDNHPLSKSELQKIITESNLLENTGNIQFEEEWFWDRENLQLKKRVKKIMFGYEIYDSEGKLRGYKASFVVALNVDKN